MHWWPLSEGSLRPTGTSKAICGPAANNLITTPATSTAIWPTTQSKRNIKTMANISLAINFLTLIWRPFSKVRTSALILPWKGWSKSPILASNLLRKSWEEIGMCLPSRYSAMTFWLTPKVKCGWSKSIQTLAYNFQEVCFLEWSGTWSKTASQ